MSLTGQTRKFVKKLDWPSIELTPDMPIVELDEPYIIVAQRTYTEEIREKAAKNGARADIIMPDGADGNISANPMSLLLT